MSYEGRAEMQAKLKADSAVTAKVGTYASEPAIYSTALMPEAFDGAGVSMYLSSPTDGGDNLQNYRNTISCWSKRREEVEELQDAVFTALNRHAEGSTTFFKCSKIQVIPPPKKGGDYNAPVEVLVRQR